MATHTTLLGSLLETGVQVVLFTVYLAVNIIEGLPSQCPTAGAADKAPGVVEIAHGLAGFRRPRDPLPTGKALTKVFPLGGLFHVILQLLGEGGHFLFDAVRDRLPVVGRDMEWNLGLGSDSHGGRVLPMGGDCGGDKPRCGLAGGRKGLLMMLGGLDEVRAGSCVAWISGWEAWDRFRFVRSVVRGRGLFMHCVFCWEVLRSSHFHIVL